ncbi:exportin-4 [Patella vulgata]|uniref:exportin-4 n=1 Tax=Patella vulgata TaxID=6465 RepID=UPI00217FBDB3|nr:exportin-4 [Patella vulgata]
MELLTNLLSKDFIDFGPPEETPHTNGQVEGADVVMYGLNMLVPLMSAELLKFPSLCSQYFKLLTFLTDIHPEKFTSLPENLFKALVTSVEHGLTAFGPDITKMCLEIITSLATYVFESNLTGSVLHTTMSHFLKLVFHMLLLESFDMDLIETASTALFCLICCHQDHYRELVNQLLQSQIEEQYKQRLLVAFNNLTPPTLTMTINRQSKIAFMQNFDQFLVNVRGFLCIK